MSAFFLSKQHWAATLREMGLGMMLIICKLVSPNRGLTRRAKLLSLLPFWIITLMLIALCQCVLSNDAAAKRRVWRDAAVANEFSEA